MTRKFFTIMLVALLAVINANAASTYYSASFETTGSGHVSLNKTSSIKAGETLRLFLLPAENWRFESVKVVLASNPSVEMELADYYDPNYTAYSFEAPEGDIIVRATFVHVFYRVDIDQPYQFGSLSVDKEKARPGEEITVTVDPFIEYDPLNVIVSRDDNGNVVPTTRNDKYTYTFTMVDSDVIISAAFSAKEHHTITIENDEYGVATTKSEGVKDEIITVEVETDMGYEVDVMSVTAITSEYIGHTHYEPVEVTREDERHFSFVMPDAWVKIHVSYKKISYPVNIVEGLDKARFSLWDDRVPGYVGGYERAAIFIYPNEPTLRLSKLTLTDEDDNELDYQLSAEDWNDGVSYEVSFTMPYSPISVVAQFKSPQTYAINLSLDESLGELTADKSIAYPGETVTLTVNSIADHALKSLTCVAGYGVKGGSGGAHAPLRSDNNWFKQQDIEVTKIDDTHYQFTLPESFDNELSPNYMDNTEFIITAEIVYVGPRVIYCSDNHTLYFNYDSNPTYYKAGDSYNGHTVSDVWSGNIVSNTAWSRPGWSSFSWAGTSAITTVVIEDGFAAVRPKSCYAWFNNMKNLTTIEGIENLNTSEVTNMNSMFLACTALATINVNSFDTGAVTNMNSMFRSCPNLTTIYCDNSWSAAESGNMFAGCTLLVGAVPYNSLKDDGAMANPNLGTGYFTGQWNINVADVADVVVSTPEKAYTNETVHFTMTSQFSTVQGVQVKGEISGNEISVTATADGDYSFVMPAEPVLVTPTMEYPEDGVVAVLWCQDNSTLYFVQQSVEDLFSGTWDGHTITSRWTNEEVTNLAWATPGWNTIAKRVTTVVFDDSFATVQPKSCYCWFYDFNALNTIENIENLNTSEVTIMNSMFLNCKSLVSIDVNTFDVSKVTNASSMFNGCVSLRTIYCNNTWDIATASGMFGSSSILWGAVPYNGLNTGISMANPKTGYFTGKWAVNIPSQFDHGQVLCDVTEAYTNATVTLVVVPDQKYELKSLVVTRDDEQSEPSGAPLRAPRRAVALTHGEGNTYTFVMPPSGVNVSATFVESFVTAIDTVKKDVDTPVDDAWYTIDGRRLPAKPTTHGIYINAGRKVRL